MRVKVENFEGPIGLLLDLIEKKKMPINDISLAEISSQFLDRVKSFENFSRVDIALFIETASILMLIKSRSLLPQMEMDDEDNQSIDELERRLMIYKLIRESSETIKNIYGKTPMFQRESFISTGNVFIKPANLSLENIIEAVKNAINCLPKEENLPEVKVGKTIKLEEKIFSLSLARRRKCLSFVKISGTKMGSKLLTKRRKKNSRQYFINLRKTVLG